MLNKASLRVYKIEKIKTEAKSFVERCKDPKKH